jgi:hypothetical protein
VTRSFRRAVCLLLGHRPGAEVFRYVQPPKITSQWPQKRGQNQFEAAGFECSRCLVIVVRVTA